MAYRLSPERPVSPVSSASTADVTAGYDISTIINLTLDASSVHDDGAQVDLEVAKHWLRVSNLDINTTSDSLKFMFYQFCGDEAFTLWDNGVIGFVGFESRSMLDLAVEKMNNFIPRHQSHPLRVVKVSLEDVLTARSAAPLSYHLGVVPLLYSDCPVKVITEAIEMRNQPASCAAEIVREAKRAPRPVLKRILAALVELRPSWVPLEEFRESLVRELLRHIRDEDSRDHAANCGTLLGELFIVGFLVGDPFHLATSILQRGVDKVVQIDNICALAHTCVGMQLAISKASFWAVVGQTSLCVGDPLRTALLGHLRRFQRSTELLYTAPTPQSKSVSWAKTKENNNTTHRQTFESKSRTVYVSHLPPHMTVSAFAELLAKCGEVSKVRVCRGTGYATLFAFVEMTTVEDAKAVLRLSRTTVMGCNIRVHIAKNPIQDTLAEDASVDANGLVTRCCLFGKLGGTLIDALAACEKFTVK